VQAKIKKENLAYVLFATGLTDSRLSPRVVFGESSSFEVFVKQYRELVVSHNKRVAGVGTPPGFQPSNAALEHYQGILCLALRAHCVEGIMAGNFLKSKIFDRTTKPPW
jgi:hypothetical protein